MERMYVVSVLNKSLESGPDNVTVEFLRMMSTHIEEQTTEVIPVKTLIESVRVTPLQVVRKYVEGIINSLVKKYSIEVITNGFMSINGQVFKKITQYK